MRFNFKKMVKIGIMMWFYSFVSELFLFPSSIQENGFVKAFIFLNIPTILFFLQYYILLMFACPILNKVIGNLTQKQYVKLLLFFFIIFSISPTFIGLSMSGNDRGFGIINFIFMYFIGAYLSRFGCKLKNRLLWLGIYIVSSLFVFFGNMYVIMVQGVDKACLSHFYAYDCSFVIISAVSLFMVFKLTKIESKAINFCATGVLGVYALHEQPPVKLLIYTHLFPLATFYTHPIFIVYAVGIAFVVLVVCLAIEFVRYKLFNTLENKLIDWFFALTFIKKIEKYLTEEIISKENNHV